MVVGQQMARKLILEAWKVVLKNHGIWKNCQCSWILIHSPTSSLPHPTTCVSPDSSSSGHLYRLDSSDAAAKSSFHCHLGALPTSVENSYPLSINFYYKWLGFWGRGRCILFQLYHPNDLFAFLTMKNDRDLGFMYNDRSRKGFSNFPRHKPSKGIKLSFTTQIASTCFLLSHWWLPDFFI